MKKNIENNNKGYVKFEVCNDCDNINLSIKEQGKDELIFQKMKEIRNECEARGLNEFINTKVFNILKKYMNQKALKI